MQAVLPLHLVSTATSIVVLFQFLGGSTYLAVAQNVFDTRLHSGLRAGLPSLDPSIIVKAGAGNVRHAVDANDLQTLLKIYNAAIIDTFVSHLFRYKLPRC